ncbi:hypothetical protein TSUD_99650 [Trifolium subterraneum]|uniref:Uncharacterized protein n=1 Tax=Trifolium subterraneum TaxID=3900 RepID=A0A2Z6NXR8_TRISU|nr:hypothetical protein TSUD_99650 [Trifolium subterraneum]
MAIFQTVETKSYFTLNPETVFLFTSRSSLAESHLSAPELPILIDHVESQTLQIRSQRCNPTSLLTTTSLASFPYATTLKFFLREYGSSVSPENMIYRIFPSFESLNHRTLIPNLTFSFQSTQQNKTTTNPNLAFQPRIAGFIMFFSQL